MPSKLTNYRDKRDPGRTNEPFGAEPLHSGAGTLSGSFVVHLHAASRTHYDLRLELGGALQSFAVPRGPSLNPEDKRLAVHTEDHPLDYLDFEAVIPEGNYGAGAMIVWDRGAVRYLEGPGQEGLARGKLDFLLFGHKLRGRFALIRTSGRRGEQPPKQEQWLLVKKQDEHARAGEPITEAAPWSILSGLTVNELPLRDTLAAELAGLADAAGAERATVPTQRLSPMLCTDTGSPLRDPRWLYELKLDGVRILATRENEQVALRYRTGRNASDSYPEIVRAMASLAPSHVVLDGEIVAYDDRGRPDFQRLGPRIQATRGPEARKAAASTAVAYLVFDILALEGRDLRPLPLRVRKKLLTQLLKGKGLIRVLDHIPEHGQALLDFCEREELEGMVAKRADSPYLEGPERSGHWVKHKCHQEDDFVVIGYTAGKGRRQALGALELASFLDGRLVARGRVGSGIDDNSIDLLLETLSPLHRKDSPAAGDLPPTPAGKPVRFVEPEHVVRVRYLGWTREGRLRHPVFLGLRADMSPKACRAAPSEERESAALTAAEARSRRAGTHTLRGRVPLTNQAKVFWPDEGYTKGDLVDYYASIAETLLPYLRERPVLMVRYPDGIRGKSFYQWNVPKGLPSWVPTFALRSQDHDGKQVTAFVVNDVDTLVYMANLGAIPLHVLASRSHDLETCDFLTVDFDLGGAPLADAVTLARDLHSILDGIGLASFPKTSGQTGLHVLVPLGGVPFPTAKMLAELLGRLLHVRHPEISTIERLRRKRRPGVYIDTGQTGRTRAIVAPYSVRAHPGATVSTPLHWDEVGFNLDPRRYTMFSVPERLQTLHDPLQGLLTARPDIPAAVQALGALLP